MTTAEFRKLWLDRSLTLQQIADRMGLSYQCVQHRASARGFGPRPRGHNEHLTWQPCADFADMWRAGVGLSVLVSLYGVRHGTILSAVARLGLPKRNINRHTAIGLAEFREMQMARRMAAAAAETRKVMWVCEMTDHPSSGKRKVAA